jgi:PAS domain S-box-containing protein
MHTSTARDGLQPHAVAARGARRLSGTVLTALLVAASYYVGSKVGFTLRFPSIPTSIIWPPNSVLMAGLMLIPPRRWWACLLATLATHVLAQSQMAIPPAAMFLLFATNAGMAALGAYAVRRLCGGPPRFGYVRDLVLFLVFAVFAAPFVTSFPDAAIVVLTKLSDNYALVFEARFLSNALTVLTLVPAIVIWATNGRGWLRAATPRGVAEGCLLALGLGVAYAAAYSEFGPSFAPALLYGPLPFLMWAALRFGAGGVSTSLLAVLLISISYAIGGRGPFASQAPAEDIVGLQLFLIAISVPIMMLAAVTEERRRAAEALSRSEEFNRQIVESSSESIKILDLGGNLLYLSPKGQELLGIDDPRPFLNTPWIDLWGDEGRGAARDAVARAKAGESSSFRSFRLTARGERKWWDTVVTPMKNAGGNVERLLAVSRDITEQRQAEEALRESESRLRLAQQAARVGTWEYDVARGASVWSEMIWHMLGLEPGDGAPTFERFLEFIHPEDRDRFRSKVGEALADGEEYENEFRLVRHDGEVLCLASKGRVIRSASGQPERMLGVNIDITGRKRAEEALRESEERFRHMANNAPVVIWVTEPDGSCTFISQTWRHLTGQAPESGLGFRWIENVHPDDRARARDAFLAANERREAYRIDYRLHGKDGAYRWAIDSGAPRFNSRGEFLGFIGSVIDITERKRAEQSLEQLTGRLLQLQDEERRRIARELHDTTAQNLLAIVLNLETLVRKASTLPADFVDAVSECQSLCEQTQAEIRTLSYLLHPPMLDEAGLILALEWFIDGFSRRSGIRVDFVAPPEFRRLPSRMETALFRVVQESLTNIYRHSGSRTAEIRLERGEGQVRLRITDCGSGMAATGNGRAPAAGSAGALGVGISGMRERLRQLGGRLEVRSNGAGTSVTALLPLGKGGEG